MVNPSVSLSFIRSNQGIIQERESMIILNILIKSAKIWDFLLTVTLISDLGVWNWIRQD